MSRICYSVQAAFRDEQTADEYTAWIAGGHADQVVKSGASSSMIVRLDPEPSGNPEGVGARFSLPARICLKKIGPGDSR